MAYCCNRFGTSLCTPHSNLYSVAIAPSFNVGLGLRCGYKQLPENSKEARMTEERGRASPELEWDPVDILDPDTTQLLADIDRIATV